MVKNSKIEWTDHTFNPWIGCTKVSDGCKHCYAEALMGKRYGRVKWGPQGTRVRTSAANWRKPLQWNKQQWEKCADCGWRGPHSDTHDFCPECDGENLHPTRQRVFCASLADVFEIQPGQPEMAQWRMDLFELIRLTPNLDWLLLTKRPENVMILEPVHKTQRLPDNVWIGTSVENQETADERILKLLRVPARVRFLSCEPLLGPVNLYSASTMGRNYIYEMEHPEKLAPRRGIDWVIVGGESGHGARPMHPDWARYLRDQCVASGVAFHFKQWGEWVPSTHAALRVSTGNKHTWAWPWANGNHGDLGGDTTMVVKVGKAAAGRILDGRTWDEFPKGSTP